MDLESFFSNDQTAEEKVKKAFTEYKKGKVSYWTVHFRQTEERDQILAYMRWVNSQNKDYEIMYRVDELDGMWNGVVNGTIRKKRTPSVSLLDENRDAIGTFFMIIFVIVITLFMFKITIFRK